MLLQISTNTGWFRQSVMALILFSASGLMLAAAMSDLVFAQQFSDETGAEPEKKMKKKETTENKSDAKTNAAENAKTIEALEERIKILEEKLARLSGETPALTAKTGNEIIKSDEVKADAIDEIKKD